MLLNGIICEFPFFLFIELHGLFIYLCFCLNGSSCITWHVCVFSIFKVHLNEINASFRTKNSICTNRIIADPSSWRRFLMKLWGWSFSVRPGWRQKQSLAVIWLLVLVWWGPPRLPDRPRRVCLFSLCERLAASRVDVIFQTAHQSVYVLGARKFFQINTAWFDLGGQTYQETNSVNRWGGKPPPDWSPRRGGEFRSNEILINVGGLRAPPTVYDGQFISRRKVNTAQQTYNNY